MFQDPAGGLAEGRVFSNGVQLLPGAGQDELRDDGLSGERAKSAFQQFILGFRFRNSFPYRDKLRQNWALGKLFLEVDLDDLGQFNATLVGQVRKSPADMLPLLEEAATRLARDEFSSASDRSVAAGISSVAPSLSSVQLLLRDRGNAIPIRHLCAAHVSQLVIVSGVVISASRVQAKATHLTLRCRNKECNDTLEVSCGGGFGGANIPAVCQGRGRGGPGGGAGGAGAAGGGASGQQCGPNPYMIVADRSRYCDHQVMKLQECPETVPTGDMPRYVLLSADRYLVDKAPPGTRVTVVGVFMIPSVSGKKSKRGKGAEGQSPYLRVVGMELERDGSGRMRTEFTLDEEEQFSRLARKENIRDLIAASIAPAIFGHEDIKRMVACLLFGGTRKFLPDGMKLRGDINVLLLGDPGTGKSQILKFAKDVAPVGVFTSGKGSSAAGLTASVIQDPGTREFYLEGGAMVLADGGVVCIAEGTLIMMSNGFSKPIEDVQPEDLIVSPAFVKGSVQCNVFSRCSKKVFNGQRECVELVFEDGRTLVCTPNHKLLTSAKGEWIEAQHVGEHRVAVSPLMADVPHHQDEKGLAAARLAGLRMCQLQGYVSKIDTKRIEADMKLLESYSEEEQQQEALSSSKAFLREMLAVILGRQSCEGPKLRRDGSFEHVRVGLEWEMWLNVLGVEVSPSGHVDTLQFAERVGFRYNVDKEIRLGIACAWLRSSKPETFLDDVGARSWFTDDLFCCGESLPTIALRVVERRLVGSRRVYDLSVPGNTSFLANGVSVHNCIDEFDKMRLSDQVAIHEAMEQQTISIAKAGLCTVLNARTSVLAAANPIFGSYDESREADQNIQFHATILSRFDAIFLIKDRRNEKQDRVVASHVLDLHINQKAAEQIEVIPIEVLKRYIAYARAKCQPRLDEDAAEELQNHYVLIRDSVRQRSVTAKSAAPVPITVRQLEAIVRISESLAKQELSPVATRAHVLEAIRLFSVSTLDAATSGVASAENLTPELMQEIQTAEGLLKRRLAIGSKMSERRLVQDFQQSNISPEATRRAINIMVQRGELEYRQQRKAVVRKR